VAGPDVHRVVRAAVAAHPPGRQPGEHGLARDVEVHGQVETAGLGDVEQRLGLRHRPGEAVEDEAAGAGVVEPEALVDDPHDHVVGQEVPRVHVLLRLPPELRALADRRSEDVTGRDVGHHVVAGEPHALGALPRTLSTEQDQPGAGDHR
jgi:hypothetical protein